VIADLRIISYSPNPRIWKATIAGRLCKVDIDVRGGAPAEMQDWLWDFDARPLTDDDRQADQSPESTGRRGFKGKLYKTEALLDAIPFGTTPAALSPDGKTGIFESNSITLPPAATTPAIFVPVLWHQQRLGDVRSSTVLRLAASSVASRC
jgi:hypothetical protein